MVRTHSRGLLVPLILACQLLLPFCTLPLHAEQTSPATITENKPPDPVELRGIKGVASYYANHYDGRKTYSGIRYNPENMTAAHPDLPIGTRVRVVNQANGREVVVTVNDRCRKKKFPFIDLSRAAAKKLGFFGKGIAKVTIIALGDEAEVKDNE